MIIFEDKLMMRMPASFMGIEVSKDAGIFLSLNYPKSLNDVCKGFRALAAHIGELFV